MSCSDIDIFNSEIREEFPAAVTGIIKALSLMKILDNYRHQTSIVVIERNQRPLLFTGTTDKQDYHNTLDNKYLSFKNI